MQEMKMQSKKIYAMLITAILVLSMVLAVMPMASAINAPTLSPSSGPVGQKVRVDGTGASVGGLVEVYWENLGGPKLNQTYASGTGAYSCYVTIPESVGGNHYIIVKDVSTGATAAAAFAILPKITLSPSRGIPGDSIAVSGKGFTANSNIKINFSDGSYYYEYPGNLTVTPSPLKSNSLGSFSATFVVPVVTYGSYTVNATDAAGKHNATTFTVGAAITLTPTSGPTGTVVSISGRGFLGGKVTSVRIDSTNVPTIPETIYITAGTFSAQLIIPTVNVGSYTITVSDNASTPTTATASFQVTGKTGISLSPTAGQPGWTVTIEGANFTAIEGTAVTVTFGALTVKTLYTNATGGFKGTFTVPSLPTGLYPVTATDAKDLTATANFKIAITLIVLSPAEGPTGKVVTVTGYGFTTGEGYNVTMNGVLLKKPNGAPATDTVGSGGTFTIDVLIPTKPVGEYTIRAMDAEGLTASATFKVTKTTELILTPSSAPRGYTVKIEANYFTAAAGKTITFKIKNATWTTTLTVSPTSPWTGTATNGTGSFKGTFAVSSAWALGSYVINATDANGLTVEVPFSVVTLTITVYTRSAEYLQGDTVSFYVKSAMNSDGTIKIVDPTGYPYGTIALNAGDWVLLYGYYVMPYNKATIQLPSDAPLGEWSWTATIGDAKATGTFTVRERPTLATILDRLGEVNATLSGLITDAEGNLKAYIDTSLGPVTASLNSINATLVSIKNGVATISTTVGEIKVTLQALDLSALTAKLESIKDGVATVSTSIGTVTTTLNDINTKVVSISGDVATIKTDLGTLTGKVTSIDGTVATIKTDVGTIKADISDVKTDVATVPDAISGVTLPIWIAVVLSLIAAIAAIYAVITIRRKIAG